MNRQKNHTNYEKKAGSRLSGKQAAGEIIRLCTTAGLSPERKTRISGLLSGKVDWKYLLNLAHLQGIAPLISRNLGDSDLKNQVPESCLEQLDDVYNKTLYKNLILSGELLKVLSAFRQRGIPVISLKGTVLAEMLYANPALRTVADIDILVRPDDLPRAGTLLLEIGYEQLTSYFRRPHPFHETPYYKKTPFPTCVELHWDLEDKDLVTVPGEKLWNRAQTIKLQRGETMVLSPEDTLLFSVIQLGKEFGQLKVLADITEIIKKYRDVLDWRYLVESARSWDIGTAFYYALKITRDFLETPVPQSVIKELKPKAWRRCLVGILLHREIFVSPAKWPKLREETLVLVRGLMMKNPRRTRLVLAKYRGAGKRAAWLRTSIWIILVFVAALGSSLARATGIKI